MISRKIVILFICLFTVYTVSAFGNSSRSRRAQGATLSKIIFRFETLAHITSAASLEIGLTNGQIDSDKVIAELLHMGALEIQDVSKLDQAAIDKSIGILHSLPEKLNGKQEILDMESRLVVLEELGKLPPWTEDFEKFKGKQEYVDFLKKMGDLANTKNTVKKYATAAGGIAQVFESLESIENIDKEVQYAITQFGSMVSNVDRLVTSLQNSDTVVAQLKEVKEVIEKSKFINLLTEEHTYRTKKLKSTFSYDSNIVKNWLENVAKVQNIAKDSESSRNSFQTIQHLISSQKSLAKLSFEYTAGLPRGSEDLVKLNRDSMDEWIKMRVSNGSLVSESLSKAFAHFEDLASTLKVVETAWIPLGQSESIDSIAQTQLAMATIPKDLQTVTGHLNRLEECEKNHRPYPTPKFDNIEDTLTTIDSLNGLVAQLNTLENISQFKKLPVLQKNFDLSKVSDKEKAAKEVVGKMSTDPELMKGIQDLKDFQTNLTNVETSLTNIATEISKIDIPKIEKYHEEAADSKYLGLYPCLNKEVAKGSAVKDLIQIIRILRALPKQIGTSELQSLYSSKSQLEKVQESMEKIRKIEDREVKNLEESFKDSVQVSKSFGIGVQGLLAIKTAADAKSDLTPLLDNSELLKDASGYPELLKILQHLAQTYQGIETFLGTISSFDGFRRRRGVDFRSDNKVFEEAARIESCQFDMKKLRNAIEVVNKNGKYSAAMTSLDTLKKLDLDFVKFNFNDAAASLEAIDRFFTSYASSMALLPSSAPPQMVPVDPTSSDVYGLVVETTYMPREEAPNSTWEDYKWWFIGGIIVFIIVIVGVSLLFWFCCRHVCCSSCMDDPDDVIHDDVENPHQKDQKVGKVTATVEKDKKTDAEKHSNVPKEVAPDIKVEKNLIGDGPTGGEHEKKGPEKQEEQKEQKELKVFGPQNKPKPPKLPVAKHGITNLTLHVYGPKKSSGPEVSTKDVPSAREAADRKHVGDIPLCITTEEMPVPTSELSTSEVIEFLSDFVLRIEGSCWSERKGPDDVLSSWIDYINTGETKQQVDRGRRGENKMDRISCNRLNMLDTMVPVSGFKHPYINVSCMKFDASDKLWLVGQDPMEGTEFEMIQGEKIAKNDTRAKHLAVLHQHDVKELMQFQNNGVKFYSDKAKGKMSFGQYEVVTVSVTKGVKKFTNPKKFAMFELQLTDKNKKVSKKMNVLYYKWKNPVDPRDGLEILKHLEEVQGNVMLQDYMGLGPSCVILAIKQGISFCLRNKIYQLGDFIHPIRRYRTGAVRELNEVLYMILCIARGLMDIRKIGFAYHYHSFEHFYQRTRANNYVDEKKRIAQDCINDQEKRIKYVRNKYVKYQKKVNPNWVPKPIESTSQDSDEEEVEDVTKNDTKPVENIELTGKTPQKMIEDVTNKPVENIDLSEKTPQKKVENLTSPFENIDLSEKTPQKTEPLEKKAKGEKSKKTSKSKKSSGKIKKSSKSKKSSGMPKKSSKSKKSAKKPAELPQKSSKLKKE